MKSPEFYLTPQRGALSPGRQNRFHLLARIVPPAPQQNSERPSLNLALVLDRSGSMSGGKLELAQEAACNLISNLRTTDRVGVVAFDTTVSCIAPNAPVTDVKALHRAIRAIHTASQTALHEGWLQGGLQVSENFQSKAVNRIVLLTDGQANIGEANPDVLASHSNGLAARGVSTTSMGIGDDYDEVLLEGMSRAGDGNFYHIQSAAQFEEFFAVELQGLCNLYGRSARLEVAAQPGVTVTVLNRLDTISSGGSKPSGMLNKLFSSTRSAPKEQIVLPNLIGGVPVEISMMLEIDRVPKQGEMLLLDLHLSWEDSETKKERRESVRLCLPVVSAEVLAERYPESAEVLEHAVLMEIAALKHEANQLIRSGSLEPARNCLHKASALVSSAPSSGEIDAEKLDLEYLQQLIQRGEYASVSKHAYYQSHQRSYSKTSTSSGRETRDMP